MMKKLFAATMVVVSTALAVFAFENSVAGTWNITGSVAGNDIAWNCALTQSEGKIGGTCKSDSAGTVNVTGEVKDKKVKFQHDLNYNGTALTIIYSGALDDAGTAISGDIDVQPFGVTGSFTAKKEAAK